MRIIDLFKMLPGKDILMYTVKCYDSEREVFSVEGISCSSFADSIAMSIVNRLFAKQEIAGKPPIADKIKITEAKTQ
jgi:hypothetical protein